jgi:hypothetical protein
MPPRRPKAAGRIAIGAFEFIELPVRDPGENRFRISSFDQSGQPTQEPMSVISVFRTYATAAALPTTLKTIAAKVRAGTTRLRNVLQRLIAKGTPPPAKGTHPLRTKRMGVTAWSNVQPRCDIDHVGQQRFRVGLNGCSALRPGPRHGCRNTSVDLAAPTFSEHHHSYNFQDTAASLMLSVDEFDTFGLQGETEPSQSIVVERQKPFFKLFQVLRSDIC